ncbi:hypothetical protein NQZ68_001270 [Dissostichus eleginoides]|nr:hypothetical protein NQZ68_001270 [Dissostichus eleginoides]
MGAALLLLDGGEERPHGAFLPLRLAEKTSEPAVPPSGEACMSSSVAMAPSGVAVLGLDVRRAHQVLIRRYIEMVTCRAQYSTSNYPTYVSAISPYHVRLQGGPRTFCLEACLSRCKKTTSGVTIARPSVGYALRNFFYKELFRQIHH